MKAYELYLKVCEILSIEPHPESSFDDVRFVSLRSAWVMAFIRPAIERYCQHPRRSLAGVSRNQLKDLTYGMLSISEQDRDELDRDKIIQELSKRSSWDLCDFSGVFIDVVNKAESRLREQLGTMEYKTKYDSCVSEARRELRKVYERVRYNDDERKESKDPVIRATHYVDMCAELACLAIIGCIIDKAAEAYPTIYTTAPNKVGVENRVYELACPSADYDADSVHFIARKKEPEEKTNWIIVIITWSILAAIVGTVYFS